MPIYGAGCTNKPKIFFVFMNPTGRNVSALPEWRGIRAPWLGTKNVWKLFRKLGLIDEDVFTKTQKLRPNQWTPEFGKYLYSTLSRKKVYITNLAKCTQPDARALRNRHFKVYLDFLKIEIEKIGPKNIVTFGNLVSSIFLGKNISVADYNGRSEIYFTLSKKKIDVYPVYYPVGQGMRNMSKAVNVIKKLIVFLNVGKSTLPGCTLY